MGHIRATVLLWLAAAVALLGIGGEAHAFVPSTITIAPPFAMANLQRELLERRVEDSEPHRQGEQAAPVAPSTRFTFTPSRARTQTNVRNFVARTPHPAARAELEQMFAVQPGLMDEISTAARSFGFDPHNVADAYAMWWMNAWLVANKRDEVPDAATVKAVKRQVRNAFAATPDFAVSGDAERQEYAEALLLQATMLGSMFEQSKNDPKLLDQLAEAARQGAKASGIDLSEMTLTQAGFVPRKER
ncbi:DUF6683 family protein [Erythrobacter sp. R86502]|uniref:DUF6683 family protein n=1 Tax=Erythrobacter sp. R86502 TaxID=3093846 RepID=UPI0036D330A1